jgi:hypothetical protein
MQYGNTTVIAVSHPTGGDWTVTPDAGSVPVTSVAYAKGLPNPDIKARVLGRGQSRTLSYDLTPAAARAITFVEQGPRTYHIIGAAHGPRGRIRFTPAAGRPGRRQIVAVVTDHGVQSQSLIVARYAAPRPQRLVRPRRVSVRHHGYTLDVSWTPVAGAAIYEVLVQPVDGGRETAIVRGDRARVVGIEPGLRGKVLVNAVTFEGMRGTKGAGTFTRAPVPKPKRPTLRRPKPRRHHR